MGYVESNILIEGDIDEVYCMAKDMERYSDFMPDVKSVKIVETSINRTTTEWVTSVDGTPICWTEVDEFDDAKKRIKYRLVEGDLDKFEGSWIFLKEGDKTKVRLTVDFDFGMPTLAELVGPVLEEKVRENSMMMLMAIKREIEKGNSNS